VTLSRAANIIRRDILKFRDVSFEGSFETDCQENSVPASLMTLIRLILGCTDIRYETNYKSQKCLSISQLLLFNFEYDRRRGGTGSADTSVVKHSNKYETPLPLFLGSFIHSKTRSKELVDTLYRLGLSVSYGRVLSLSGDLGNANRKHFHDVGTLYPPQLKIGILTTSAVDNFDHDPTSPSALGSFHGTSISLFQHPDNCEQGRKQELIKTPFDRAKSFINYLRVTLRFQRKEVNIPEYPEDVQCNKLFSNINLVADEQQWFEEVCESLGTNSTSNTNVDEHCTWAAFHSRRDAANGNGEQVTSLTALLPLSEIEQSTCSNLVHSQSLLNMNSFQK